jgi:predicted membrane protein
MAMRYIFGIGLVIIGIGLLFSQFGIFNFGDFIYSWWPMLVIFIGLSRVISDKNIGYSGYFIIAMGVLLQLNSLNIINTGFWSIFWPLILIYIGISFIFKNKKKIKGSTFKDNNFEIFNVFSEDKRTIDSQDFENGEVTSVFGSSRIDFRESDFYNGEATVDVSVTFGSVVFIVPPDMNIKTNGFPIFGALENKTMNPTSNPNFKTLNIKYFVVFGSLEIKNK